MGEKKNRLLTNMMSYAVLQIVNMMVGLFLPRLYLAVYGSEINGVVSTVNSFISYFSYLEAGLGLTLIHSLFKPLAKKNYDELNGLLAYSQKKYKEISYIYFALVLIASFLFPIINPTMALGKVEFFFLVCDWSIRCFGFLWNGKVPCSLNSRSEGVCHLKCDDSCSGSSVCTSLDFVTP